MLVKVRKFLTESNERLQIPVPLRTMRIVDTFRESEKGIYVRLQGTPLPSDECVHCGRTITHPVSLHFGIGSTCIRKYPQLLESVDYDDVESSYNRLKDSMSKITWVGWLPKGHIELIPEEGWVIEFEYKGTPYRVTTYDTVKRDRIIETANILSMEAVQ